MRKIRTSDGSWTCFSETYDQTFHSSHGAETESRQVFLQASGMQTRLNAKQPSRVLEVGFGLGLNFLLTADQAVQNGCDLYYHAFEHSLIDPGVFEALEYASLVEHSQVYALALQAYQIAGDCQLSTNSSIDGPAIKPQTISLSRCELSVANSDFRNADLSENWFDAVYLDAFSPDCNPECWDQLSCERLFNCLRDGGKLSTYSVKGQVRRALQAAGFDVEKLPGPAWQTRNFVCHSE